MKKRIYKLTPAVLALVISLAGCGQANTEINTKNTVEAEAPVISKEAAPEALTEETGEQEENGEENDPAELYLKDAITSENGLGPDAICGAAVGYNGISDEKLMALVHEHYNAVTLENELKLDCMLGYHNDACPEGSIHEEDLNGETIEVPTLDHSRADKMLDKILEWNNDNPDNKLKVRGHVLVWHSQAPDWFFREDYDNEKDYVSREVMDKRMEWYIKSMLLYYTGSDSKYKDLFYGWDVVNEAVSDATGSYRKDTDPGAKSTWWHIYQDNGFILNAFKFANEYAPADLDLYYNDYNECEDKKMAGIIKLIQDIKEEPGTRIDGFGMQGHYNISKPSPDKFSGCAKKYLEQVDKVMITELDLRASSAYDGTDATREEEYIKQAKYLRDLYEAAREIDDGSGDLAGITTWGVRDADSWLNSFEKGPQCPLLFDGDYQPKPAFYAFTDPGRLKD